jgi:hypothetical protein
MRRCYLVCYDIRDPKGLLKNTPLALCRWLAGLCSTEIFGKFEWCKDPRATEASPVGTNSTSCQAASPRA